MQGYFPRVLSQRVVERLENMPAVAILGPRQCGKTTLALKIIQDLGDAAYLDLERPAEANKLRDPEAFFEIASEKLVCLDEIQRLPDLFPILRSAIDRRGKNGQFLFLGSASPNLLRQSSETLAGRIALLELTPFTAQEIGVRDAPENLRKLWLRGGFPRSYLAPDDRSSFVWRMDFIRTFLERDIPQLGFRLAAQSLERFWSMCAHSHGQVLNSSKLGASLGVSYHTVRSYVDILQQAFLLRMLPPFELNIKKRLVKSPKIYIRDSGLLHALLGIVTAEDLFGHPYYGESWEGFVIENVLSSLPGWQGSFYRTQAGAELDLVLEKGRKRIGVECKSFTTPQLLRGFWSALEDLELTEAYIVAPVKEPYPIGKGVTVIPLGELSRLSGESS